MGICDFLHCEGNLMGQEQARPDLGIHYCHLTSEMDYGMPQQIPTVTFWPKLCRISRKLCLPTYLHRDCKYYHPTRASITLMWTKIAATNYPCIVHPCSRFQLLREFFMFIIWSYLWITRPCLLAFNRINLNPHLQLLVLCSLGKLLNIVMNFLTAFKVPKRRVILDAKAIARKYMFTYFIFDLLDLLPYEYIYYIFGWNTNSHFAQIMVLQLLQFFRIITYFQYIKDILYVCHVTNQSAITIVCYLLTCCIQIHWLTCVVCIWPDILYSNPDKVMHSVVDQYCIALSKVTHHFLLGSTSIENYEVVPLIITLILGCIFNVVTLGNRIVFVANQQKPEIQSIAHEREVMSYMIAENLSMNVRQRVELFFKHKRRVQCSTEQKLNQFHSEHLRNEIYLHACSHLIKTMPLFQNLTKDVIGRIIVNLKPVFFLAGDIIVKVNDEGANLILLSYGKVAFYTEMGMEVSHVSDGSILGIAAFFIGKHCWTMVAIDSTEAFTWDFSDVRATMKQHEKVHQLLKNSFAQRFSDFESFAYEKRLGKFNGPNAKIHMLLRTNKILEKRPRNKQRMQVVDVEDESKSVMGDKISEMLYRNVHYSDPNIGQP